MLHQVQLESRPSASTDKGKARASGVDADADAAPSPWIPVATSQDATTGLPRVVYEINTDSDRLEPRLRVLVRSASAEDSASTSSSSSLPLSLLQNLERFSEAQRPDTPQKQKEEGAETEEGMVSPEGTDMPGPSRGAGDVDAEGSRGSGSNNVPPTGPETERASEISYVCPLCSHHRM